LAWLAEAREQYGLKIITEVATPEHLEEALKIGIDGVWLGARTTTNPFATQQIADALRGVDIAVIVKNPMSPDVDLWIGAIERVLNSGISRLAAAHRGFSTYEASIYRNSPHWSVPLELRRRMPELMLLSDPSHIGGRRELVEELSQQALDRGFDGLMIECHPSPESALSDAAQQVTPESLRQLIANLKWRRSSELTDELAEYRLHIDSIDSRIMELLAERMSVARKIGEYKRARSMSVVQRERFNELLMLAEAKAEEMGVSRRFIHQIFSAIHEESVRQQIALTEDIEK
jgi:chorismate mutase